MKGDIDLCVKQKGVWSFRAIYPKDKRAAALKEAGKLKEDYLYEAVALIIDDTREIIFSYAAKGPAPTYSIIARGLKEAGQKNISTQKISSSALNNLYNNRKKNKEPEPTKPPTPSAFGNALTVGMGGFGVSIIIIIMMIINGASIPSIMMVLLMMGSITISLAVWIHSTIDEASPIKQEEKRKLLMQKKLQKTEAILSEATSLAKPLVWDDEQKKFKEDGHFALILYLLGMSQGFTKTLGTDQRTTNQQVTILLNDLGITPESVLNTALNLHEYLVYPKYFNIYTQGKENILAINKDESAPISIQESIQAWYNIGKGNPQKESTEIASEETPTNFAVVGFTDIVDFTENIRTMGDEWMIDILHAHNNIVREALIVFGGYEVKHTGDGIMMSFPSVENGLKACVAIQKGINLFNEKMPDHTFDARIGISAGEPLHIDGDLFGLPVNLAARVMPFANGHEIAVAEPLYNLSQHLSYTFIPKENCELKGFDEPQTIYFLDWQQEKPEEPQEKAPDADAPGEEETLQSI